LLDIVEAIGETKEQNECFFGYEKCPLTKKCSMHYKWKDVRHSINQVLSGTSLKDLKLQGLDSVGPFIQN
jgi:DNA-binding IscR family transcriptional regulator